MKNEYWLQEGELPLSKPEFMGRLTLYAINFLDDEFMDVFFHDGGLFAGHSILVDIEKDGKPGRVQLVG
jgi:hypothetical protein